MLKREQQLLVELAATNAATDVFLAQYYERWNRLNDKKSTLAAELKRVQQSIKGARYLSELLAFPPQMSRWKDVLAKTESDWQYMTFTAAMEEQPAPREVNPLEEFEAAIKKFTTAAESDADRLEKVAQPYEMSDAWLPQGEVLESPTAADGSVRRPALANFVVMKSPSAGRVLVSARRYDAGAVLFLR